MDYGRAAERLMGMNEAVWARHAHPWSVWTRIWSGPFWFAAIWSYVWIGWFALVPVALLALWTWSNPRIFPRPKTYDAWGTKGVFGERLWLSRKTDPIPAGFRKAANYTSALAAFGMGVAAYGFVVRDFWAAFMGWHFSILAKLWFLDRMVWLWEQAPEKEARLMAWGFGEASFTQQEERPYRQ